MTVKSLHAYFDDHPQDIPYCSCPSCGNDYLHRFQSRRRPSEEIFYCFACDWNDTVVDMLATIGEHMTGTRAMYLLDDIVYIVDDKGFKTLENTGRL